MTQRIRYATSHIHELGAEIQRRVLDGYILDTSSAFCIKRQGSAYVAHFLPTRESLDFVGENDVSPYDCLVTEVLSDLGQQAQELDMGYDRQLTIQEKWEIDDDMEHEAIGEATGAEPYIDPLDIEGGEKELAEREDCGRMVYTKQELDALYWTDLQEVGRKFGVKQRDRKKLTRMILEAQEKDSGN